MNDIIIPTLRGNLVYAMHQKGVLGDTANETYKDVFRKKHFRDVYNTKHLFGC